MGLRNYRFYWAFGLLVSMLQPLHIPFWTTWHSEFPLYFGIVVSLFLYSLFEKPQRVYFFHRVKFGLDASLYLMICVLTFQYLFGLIPFLGDVLLVGVYLAVFSIGFFWGSRDVKSLELLAKMLYVASIANALVCISQALSVNDGWPLTLSLWDYRRPSGNLGQANNAGSLFVIGVIASLYLHMKRHISLVLNLISIFLLSIGLGLTQSRTALVGFFVCFLFSLFRFRSDGFWFRRKIFLGVGLLASVFWYLVAPGLQDIFFDGCWNCYGAADFKYRTFSDPSGRGIIWPQMVEIGLLNPIFGGGLLQLPGHQLDIINSENYKSLPLTYAHNVVLDAWVSMGLVGMAVVGLFLSSIFFIVAAVNFDEEKILSALVILVILVHSNFEFPHAYLYFVFPFALCLGNIASVRTEDAEQPKSRVNAAFLSALILLIGGGVALKEYPRFEEEFRAVRFEAIGVGRSPSGAAETKSFIFDQLHILVAALRITPHRNMSDSDMFILSKAVRRYHWSALQHRYALSLALNGREEEANRMLLAIKIFSGDKMYRRVLFQWAEWSENDYPELKAFQLRN